MTVIGQGGVLITAIDYKTSFKRHFKKLTPQMQALTEAAIQELIAVPRPSGLRFEKLKGYRRPDIYTVHITGNYKLSFEINKQTAILRNIGNHNKIDRNP